MSVPILFDKLNIELMSENLDIVYSVYKDKASIQTATKELRDKYSFMGVREVQDFITTAITYLDNNTFHMLESKVVANDDYCLDIKVNFIAYGTYLMVVENGLNPVRKVYKKNFYKKKKWVNWKNKKRYWKKY